MKRQNRSNVRLGKTGHFPDGKLTPEDEGGLRLAVLTDRGHVVIQFGTAISWFALSPAGARELAAVLCKRADAAEATPRGPLPGVPVQ